jgi:hypothetical protein
VLFALVAAFGLVTVVAVDIMLTAQEAEAKGCNRSIAANASKGRTFPCIFLPQDYLLVSSHNIHKTYLE